MTRVELDPLPDGAGVVVVVNPSSGGSAGPSSEEVVEQLRRELPAASVLELEDPDEMRATLEAHAPDAAAIGIAGGDGSVGMAATVAAEHHKPLLVVPGGTLNHFARDLGVESVADAVAAVRAGDAIHVERGLLGDRTFLNTASFATYPQLVDARERLEHRIGKWPALAVALARVLPKAGPVLVEIDGQPVRVWVAFVGNCEYEPAGLAPRRRNRLDDGRLDLRLVEAERPWARTRVVGAAVFGRAGHSRSFRRRVAREIRLRSLDGPLRLAADGETFEGGEDVVICKDPEPLVVYTPRESAGTGPAA